MKTLYVLTCGEYDDYRIDSIWSTQALAQKAQQAWNASGEYSQIETWYLDREIPEGHSIFEVIWSQHGSPSVRQLAETGRVQQNVLYLVGKYEGQGTFHVLAANHDEAVTLATSMREKALSDKTLKPNAAGCVSL